MQKVVRYITTMAGRPRRTPEYIVPAANILSNRAIRHEVWRQIDLYPRIDTPQHCLEWLAERKLVRNNVDCPGCLNPCRKSVRNALQDGFKWRCQRCHFEQGMRTDSFFKDSRITLRDAIMMMYFWAADLPQSFMTRELAVSKKTAIDWMKKFRKICYTQMAANPPLIGGQDANGDPIIVEIDESKYFHRKYHRGRLTEGHWVFGVIDRSDGTCMMKVVPNRKRATLEPLIEEWVLPGSRIISDGWAAYRRLDQLGGGTYQHDVVVHEQNFVDPADPEIHTNNVENMWMRAKYKLKRQFGTYRKLFPSYLREFCWRNSIGRDPFAMIIQHIVKQHPFP